MKNYKLYVHICPNNKRYYGITKTNVNQRWQNGQGYKNQMFYNAINKYGWDNIKHLVIFDSLTEYEAKELEQYMIQWYGTTNTQYGYNVSLGGDSGHCCDYSGTNNPMYGKHHREESKQKIKDSNVGKNQPKAKPVVCITTKKIFEGVRVAGRFYNVDHSVIVKCCQGKQKTAGKHENQKLIWRYVNYKHNKIFRINNSL